MASESSQDDAQNPPGIGLTGLVSATASMLSGEAVVRSLKARQDHGCLSHTVFAPLIRQALTSHFVEGALYDIGRSWPLFDNQLILTLMNEQCLAGLDNCYQDPARWATVSGFLALAIQWKAMSGAIQDPSPISWAYFKNAFSTFPQLMVQGKDIHACRAVLIMAMFMQGTGDMRAASSLIAAAAHLSQMAGLHLGDLYLDMDPGEAEQHRRVFWMIHIINNNIAMKGGPSAPLNDEYIEIDLPRKVSAHGVGDTIFSGSSLLRYMAQLSIIQSSVLKELSRRKENRRSLDVFLRSVEKLDRELQDWKTGLPLELQPTSNNALADPELEPSITQLQLTYFATTRTLHNAITHYERDVRTSNEPVEGPSPRRDRLNIAPLSPTPLEGARASIRLALDASLEPPFPQLW